ncbi:hypothetical protein C805_02418 [Eubacterium sp. 14-2]|uniref:InlB B-repeat-containing protein n=1 Tax=Eubacterium sp. 14-2 TaxID=1235790 RepID=UPI000335CA10|nr:InlB B-repeat-containing protein [Eubacterium sp. 14-2]EOT24206.1 hypothetical protein C805_02418 [Eubacterium sp. 14-2]
MRIACILLSFVLLTGNLKASEQMAEAYELSGREQQKSMEEESGKEPMAEGMRERQEPETEGMRERQEPDRKEDIPDLSEKEVISAERYNTKEEYYAQQQDYRKKDGYFYIFLRKEGDKVEKGRWYRINMSMKSLSSYKSQNISWSLLYLKKQKGDISGIDNWEWTSDTVIKLHDPFSFDVETGKKWEKTGQNGAGASPILGSAGVPDHDNGYYFKLCGKFLFGYRGYQIRFDDSIYEDMAGFDIEEENKRIQKPDDKLKEGEASWTGDGYFKFAIDTNNTGITNYGASGEFHNSVFGFKMVPNQYTVKYHANGGTGTMEDQSAVYDKAFTLKDNQFTRPGYTFMGWGLQTFGRYYQSGQSVKNLTEIQHGAVTLYAQWMPNVYRVNLDRCLDTPETAGTDAIYEKYEHGWYLNRECTGILKEGDQTGNIVIPQKTGYVFQGYDDAPVGGTQMITAEGKLTEAGIADYRQLGDTTWYASYNCLVSCEDYGDIPCDFEKTAGDSREYTGVLLSFDRERRQVTARNGKPGTAVSLIGLPAGTKIGQFESVISGSSASASFGAAQTAELSIVPQEGAAYQLQVAEQGNIQFQRAVYFKNGRFRTLVKLGEKGKKEAARGSEISGAAWGTEDSAYSLYRYTGCTSLKNVQRPGIVYRYFRYRDINMAYSGNGATSGTNKIEYGISMEDLYQFRKNEFVREENQRKFTQDGKPYDCQVKYSFEGWNLPQSRTYQEHQQDFAAYIYREAEEVHGVSDKPLEPAATYQPVEPVLTAGNRQAASESPYVNFRAEWNAFPTIVVTPGSSLEFYEGEDVKKEDLTACLTAHDEEDNGKENQPYLPDLNDKIRIVEIMYPKSENGSQEAYEKVYDNDVPEDFLLDTYYLKLEQDENVTVRIRFAVTDRNGNTTEEEFPVKIKYNNYPEIHSEEILYYLKEEANRGEITSDALAGRASAEDVEDGNLTGKLQLKDFDAQILKMQTEARAEFDLTYQVTDAYKKTTYRTVKLRVMDEDALVAELPRYYVRYISDKYLDTLEINSAWREPENYVYLREILRNETPVEIWKFTHEDVQDVQEWITENGSWKFGQEANQEFQTRFSRCRQQR